MKLSNSLYLENSIRQQLNLKENNLNPEGRLPLSDFTASRAIASKINNIITPEDPVSGSDLYLLTLLNLFYQELISYYFSNVKDKSGEALPLDGLPEYRKSKEWELYLKSQKKYYPYTVPEKNKETKKNRISDAIMLFLSNRNPACSYLRFLFNDCDLSLPVRDSVLSDLKAYIIQEADPDTVLTVGVEERESSPIDLIEQLLEPARKYPDSLEKQVQFIQKKWGKFLSFDTKQIMMALDFHREEHFCRMGGPGPVEPIDFSYMDHDLANFSQDSCWMPNIILIAKNAFVWLDQLSKKYGHSIETLRDIPDAELDELAHRGITGLWLIGLWERSAASKTIKRVCGNPEAEASAYSLDKYDIAHVLGGWKALENLKERSLQKGIRLASDMVPNHTGLDSEWVLHHPEYFLSRKDLPFPSYTFNGQDLSSDNRVGLYLEDGYFNRSDASVVFKRIDRQSGETLFMYHGNDGTTMPWNDTAQINFLEPGIREEVIQQILHVARHFPIIRFDAAMTLARKHIQRLWYPEPGKGGAIPSRSEFSMSDRELREKIPVEFWREVVDRIAEELPETLLLAEAFWMMEGYFVRNLGMHRVYNSAFMNLLKMEDNKEFRKLLKETLDYDPKILKRFVNFMNNPDEDTAVAQFGKGDKYFGVCTLMMTLPGLPMIGHGQFEGFEEKYGMEYKKAYWKETPDESLLERHEREIVPLMKKRAVFAGARGFHLFDFMKGNGHVNDNVYAFANSRNDLQALVLYNNSYNKTEGFLQTTVPKAVNNSEGDKVGTQTLNLREVLGLQENEYTLLFETKEKLWYLRRNAELIQNGLYLHLNEYQSRVYFPVEQRGDDEKQSLEKLIRRYGRRGIPNLDRAIKYAELEPAVNMLQEFFRNGTIDTPVMTDLITMLSSELNKIRKITRNQKRERPDRINTKNRLKMESVILPAVQAFQLFEPSDNVLFQMVKFYESHRTWLKESDDQDYRKLFLCLLEKQEFNEWFGINEHKNILWYNQEKMEEAVWWFTSVGALNFCSPRTDSEFMMQLEQYELFLWDLQNALAESEYRIIRVIEYLQKGTV